MTFCDVISVVTQITVLRRKGVNVIRYVQFGHSCYITLLHHTTSVTRTFLNIPYVDYAPLCMRLQDVQRTYFRVVHFKKRPSSCNALRVRTGNVFPLVSVINSLTVNLSGTIYDE